MSFVDSTLCVKSITEKEVVKVAIVEYNDIVEKIRRDLAEAL